MRITRRKLLLIAVAIILVALITQSTIAYYTVIGTATNVVTSGEIRMQIRETGADGKPFPKEGVEVIPGETVTKEVTVNNICGHPFWLRVELVQGSSKEQNLSAAKAMQILDLNEKNWTLKGNYFYYNQILEPGKKTEPLFTKVHISGEAVDQHDVGTALTITVKAEAVQSEHNPAQNAWEASGWPAA